MIRNESPNRSGDVPSGLQPWFDVALSELIRGGSSDLSHLFDVHESPTILPGTKATVRTHFLAFDANRVPAVELLSQAMAASVTDFCIPRGRLRRALEDWQKTGSTAEITKLQNHARDLFVASETSGEGGELLLFLLLEKVLGIPQILCKMPLKTSTGMHVHGSDGIHATLTNEGYLDLYWGESKLHKSASSAFSECFESLSPFLRADGAATRKQDLMLLRQHLDIGERDLALHMIKHFDESQPESMEVRFRGACLIGFDYKRYTNLKTLEGKEIGRLQSAVTRWHGLVSNHISQFELAEVDIDVFCIPFPSVSQLRKSVNLALGVTK